MRLRNSTLDGHTLEPSDKPIASRVDDKTPEPEGNVLFKPIFEVNEIMVEDIGDDSNVLAFENPKEMESFQLKDKEIRHKRKLRERYSNVNDQTSLSVNKTNYEDSLISNKGWILKSIESIDDGRGQTKQVEDAKADEEIIQRPSLKETEEMTTFCCVPVKYAIWVVAICNNFSMIAYGILMEHFNLSVAVKMIPVLYYLFLTALFINIAARELKSKASMTLYISFLLMTIAEILFFFIQIVTYCYSHIMFYFIR